MIARYIDVAMRHARYEILADDGSFYGKIPQCPGVYANAASLEECRNNLIEVLEDWILFRTYQHLDLPVMRQASITREEWEMLE